MERKGYTKLYVTGSDPAEANRIGVLSTKGSTIYAFVCLLLFTSNLCFLGLWLRATSTDCIRPQLTYSPAKNAIQYEKKRLWRDIKNNDFTGVPRPEHDVAWHRLIEPITIKISKDELSMLNESSIAFKDGSGFLAETAVFHELHCIKRIRRHLYLDYYYPNMTDDERRRESPHVDHCLEYWREAAMCRGDTTLSTFAWAEGKPFSTVYSDHECVNWELLDAWARRRMVDLTDYSILVQ